MGVLKTGLSAIGKLFIVIILAATFLVGMFGTVYLSLRGEELKVPEIVGKDFGQSEKELEAMGLKIKKRADRFSQEKPNTVLEQLPKPGDTVKSGQMILVVVSKVNPEGTEAPAAPKKGNDTPDAGDEDAIDPDKTKKSNKNSNVKRPAQTTRDVVSNKPNKNADSNASVGNSGGGNTKPGNTSTTNPNGANTKPVNKSTPAPTNSPKPNPAKTPATSGETRNRRIP